MALTIEEILLKIKVQGRKDLRDVKNSIDDVGNRMTSANVKGNLYAEGIKFAVEQVVRLGGALRDSAAAFENYQNQLKLITDGQAELDATMRMLNEAAIENRASFGETVDLFTKLTLATETMGKSQEEVVNVMGKFQKALALSGADANTAAGAIRQFGQAMASGQVRGDEFNSIVEALGPALNIMAKESGLTVGELRNLSQAGGLTAEVFFDMVAGSEALDIAFGKTQKTISQLETEFGDAFALISAKLAEQTGLASAYRDILANTARQMRLLADEGTKLDEASIEELVSDEALGSATARLEAFRLRTGELIQAVEELDEVRAKTDKGFLDNANIIAREAGLANIAFQLGINIDAAEEYVRSLNAQAAAEKEVAEETQSRLDAEAEAIAIRNKINASIKEELGLVEDYAKNQQRAKDELTQLTEERERSVSVINALQEALQQEGADVDKVSDALKVAQAEHARLGEEIKRVGEEAEEAAKKQQEAADKAAAAALKQAEAIIGSAEYFGMVERESAKLIDTQEALNSVVNQYTRELDQNLITQEEFDARMKVMGVSIEDTSEEIQTLAEFQKELREEVEEGARTQEYARKSIEVYKTALEEAGYSVEEITEKLKEFKEANNIEPDELLSAVDAFKKRWTDLAEEATDPLKQAEQQANILFGGMNDAIDQLVDDGKINFRDLADSMIKDMIRIQLQSAATQALTSIGSSIFGGFFAEGGYLPAGKVGIVGEQGPELISGPANITPLDQVGGGSQNITYNINAVDARSFKQMVAQDPEFIHSVAMSGARNMPSRRRV